MNLPTTQPTRQDIEWYQKEVESLLITVRSLEDRVCKQAELRKEAERELARYQQMRPRTALELSEANDKLNAELAETKRELTNYKLGFASQTEERIAAEQRSEDLAATLNSVLVCFCGPITTSGCEPVHIANVKGSDLHRWRNVLLGKST